MKISSSNHGFSVAFAVSLRKRTTSCPRHRFWAPIMAHVEAPGHAMRMMQCREYMRIPGSLPLSREIKLVYHCTLDGRSPAPPGMCKTLQIMGHSKLLINWCRISSIISIDNARVTNKIST